MENFEGGGLWLRAWCDVLVVQVSSQRLLVLISEECPFLLTLVLKRCMVVPEN